MSPSSNKAAVARPMARFSAAAVLGPFVEGRHRPHLARVDRAPVRSLDRAGQIERLQIPPNRALGNAQNLDQLVQSRITLAGNQFQQMSATSLSQHARPWTKSFLFTLQDYS